uniref:RRM domain-containing protein n=1 Tax=Panagrolaimus sp. JU765 TaxID=591449 RepID=A0AC34PY99_9BILA
MVKLFVGNLAETVDSHRLKNLFIQFVAVQECDVLKNFAFVHVATEEDADIVIKNLDKTMLEGREIHIERSTSRLRKEPGMGDKCFTCGASDHKTPQCPQEQGRKKKRPNEIDENPAKRINNGTISTNPVPQTQCWGYKVPGDSDAELPCPTNPELKPLYDQYIDSRTRYHYFREKLSKELSLQPGGVVAPSAAAPVNLGRIDLTRTVQPAPMPAPVPVYNATPTFSSYPGAAPTAAPTFSSPYQPQPTASYPGVQPISAPSYPGAQNPAYSTPQPSYGYNNSPAQYNTPTTYQGPVNMYNSPISSYQRPQTASYSTPPSYMK